MVDHLNSGCGNMGLAIELFTMRMGLPEWMNTNERTGRPNLCVRRQHPSDGYQCRPGGPPGQKGGSPPLPAREGVDRRRRQHFRGGRRKRSSSNSSKDGGFCGVRRWVGCCLRFSMGLGFCSCCLSAGWV